MIKHLDCNTKPRYNSQYDSYYCKKCNVWLEPPCGAVDHKECWFDCVNRPERPLDVGARTKK